MARLRRKRFCVHGHDTEIEGRDEYGACRDCHRERDRRRRALPHVKENRRTHAKGYYRKNRDYFRQKVWEQRGVDLSLEDYYAMLAAQNGRCLGCGTDTNDRALHVDHNHTTGQVRGLLCTSCNVKDALAHFH